ncbi:MAG: type II secretion system protein [Pseudomonadota bacterium]
MTRRAQTHARRAHGAGGFTLFELAIVVAIVGVLAAALLTRVVFYQEQAERANIEQTVGVLRSALTMKVSRLFVSSRLAEAADLVNENPMNWLSQKPKNYLGEFFTPDIQSIEAGNWYFDRGEKRLIYLLNSNQNGRETAPKLLKFKVKLLYAPQNLTKTHSSPAILEGVVLEQVDG